MIKYIKSVLWRVAKRLSYIEDARCLKVNCFMFSRKISDRMFHWEYQRLPRLTEDDFARNGKVSRHLKTHRVPFLPNSRKNQNVLQ